MQLNLYGHVKRRDDGNVLRRMGDSPVHEKDGEEDRKPGGKTLVKYIYKKKCVVKGDDELNKEEEIFKKHYGDPR